MVISTGYKPRIHQYNLHLQLKRFNVLVCHRRFGKTVFAVEHMRDKGLRLEKRNPQLAYIAPNYAQAKRVAWEYLKAGFRKFPKKLVKINESELRIDILRPHLDDFVRYMLLGAEKADSIRGIYLDWGVLDEFGDIHPDAWSKVVRPLLSDRKGGGIIMGTCKGDNHFKEFFDKAGTEWKGWFKALYKASETKILDDDELDSARQEMGEDAYNQEYESDFNTPLVGAYYGSEMAELERRGQITKVPYDPSRRVYTAWDLGLDDATTVWFFHEIGGEYYFFDYFEVNGKSIPEIAKEIRKKHDYPVAVHYMPHDVNVRDFTTGKERYFAFKEAGIKVITIVPKGDLQDGIKASRKALYRSRFDREKCADGVRALKNYRRAWDEERKVYEKTPLHNFASHGADAYRTFAMGYVEGNKRFPKNVPRECNHEYSIHEV